MEENVQTLTTRSVGMRYGLILGVISIILFMVLSLTGMNMTGPARWVGYPIYVVLVFLAHKYFKDNGDGYMSYSQGMGIAFWLSLISSTISSIFTYFYVKFIDGSLMEMIKEQQIKEMEAKGMSDQQMEQALKIAGMFTTPEAILIFGVVFGIIGIVVIGLLVTIFTQKNNPEPAI